MPQSIRKQTRNRNVALLNCVEYAKAIDGCSLPLPKRQSYPRLFFVKSVKFLTENQANWARKDAEPLRSQGRSTE